MLARQRWAMLALLLALAGLTVVLVHHSKAQLWAEVPPPPGSEPPIAGPPVVSPPSIPPGSPCPVDPPTPVVRLRIRVPASAAPGEEIEYRIIVDNPTPADAHQVVVRDSLPANTRFVRASPEPHAPAPDLEWRLGTVRGCTSTEIVLVLAANGPGDIANCARVSFEHGQCVTTRIEKPAGLRVRKCGPGQAQAGFTLTFEIAVSNHGPVPISNVSIIDKLPEGMEHASGKNTLTWHIGTLQPGECRSVQYQAVARKQGRLCNFVAASGDGGAFDKAESCVVIVGPGLAPAPAPGAPAPGGLALIKRGPEQRFLNRPATYQITVSNPGPAPITNVVVTDTLPAQTALVTASDAGQLAGNQVRWQIGTLNPGARRTVQLALQAQQPGEVINRAAAAADGGLTAQAEAKTVFAGATGLTFDLEVKDNPVELGAQTSYIVTVLNQGNAPATKVQVSVTLPEAMQMTDAKGPAKFQQQGQQVVFEPLAMLQAQAEARFEIVVKAARDGEAKCRAELRADQLGERPVLREQSTTIFKSNGQPGRLAPVPSRPKLQIANCKLQI
jgi:uncharacterized repeat protein (TIGR01451 family)